jgi:hypothetical protein
VILETSSWGECGNDDLPGDQAPFDKESLYFDSDPLPEDFDSFGYPEVVLTLTADRPLGALCIRLNEVSPETGASHLLSYRFYNLADRAGNMASPERVQPGIPFSLRVSLNIMGHTFKKGWRVRLALSPSFYPTLWEASEAVTITLKTGDTDGLPASALILPGREARDEDKRAQQLLPLKSAAPYVNPDDYFPVIAQDRPDETTRKAFPVTIDQARHADAKGVRQRPLPIWRRAQRSMGRYPGRGKFRDGGRRPALADRIHQIGEHVRAQGHQLVRAFRDHDQSVERA